MNTFLQHPLPRPVRHRSPHQGVCPDCATTPRVERESHAAFAASEAEPTAHHYEVAERLLNHWLRRLTCARRHPVATDPFCDTLPEEIL